MSPWVTFYWSVRRELWENRAIYVAPAIVALLALAGFTYQVARFPEKFQAFSAAKQGAMAGMPYSMAASVILLTGWIVALFYVLDALYGERRDRSILFWKSMPVSDAVTVLAKAFVPLVVVPVAAFAIAVAAQLAMLAVNAMLPNTPSNPWPMGRQTIVMAYGLAIHALWFAPIYAYLLLVSGWARRAPIMWAVVPFLALFALEFLALGSSWGASAIRYRIVGAMSLAFDRDALRKPVTELSQLDPVRFLTHQDLWLGLAFAAACLVLAVRLRRHREPI